MMRLVGITRFVTISNNFLIIPPPPPPPPPPRPLAPDSPYLSGDISRAGRRFPPSCSGCFGVDCRPALPTL
eukprot:2788746-Pyramimonas_sp.AAC.1